MLFKPAQAHDPDEETSSGAIRKDDEFSTTS
jgi:hypothetical protein